MPVEATTDPLIGQLEEGRRKVRTDRYSMSVGEIASLYRNKELVIDPAFQRLYRWEESQKSRFVESVLLGLPIPPIYVFQRSDGVWELVDGLQRVSTLLQLMGDLQDTDPLRLLKTEYLPALEGRVWPGVAADGTPLPPAQALEIRRARLDVAIIAEGPDADVKFEVFDRLNSGGSQLTPQEVRDCIVERLNPEFHGWMLRLAEDPGFCECTQLSGTEESRAYDTELVMRFVALRTLDEGELSAIGDIHEFLTDTAKANASDPDFGYDREEAAFHATFAALASAAGENCFRRYDSAKGKHLGRFLISAYEAVAIGLGYHAGTPGWEAPVDLRRRIQELWDDPDFRRNSGSGKRASQRIPKVIPIGRHRLGM